MTFELLQHKIMRHQLKEGVILIEWKHVAMHSLSNNNKIIPQIDPTKARLQRISSTASVQHRTITPRYQFNWLHYNTLDRHVTLQLDWLHYKQITMQSIHSCFNAIHQHNSYESTNLSYLCDSRSGHNKQESGLNNRVYSPVQGWNRFQWKSRALPHHHSPPLPAAHWRTVTT